MNLRKISAAAAVVFFFASSVAFAQPVTNGKGCTPQERSNKALEHDQGNAGVICPPEVDSGMTTPAPKTGDPSVIRPSGPQEAPSPEPK
jgi:hypothetical protein